MARETEVSILVRVRDAATNALRQIGPAGVRAANTARTAFASLGRTIASVARGIRSTMGGALDWLRSKIFGLPGLFVALMSGATASVVKNWVDLAAKVEQVEARFNVLFGDVRDRAMEMAQAITTGMRRNLSDIQDMMAAFEGMLQPMGIASDQSLQLADALSRLTIDFAAFSGMAETEALQAIQQGLLGRGMELKRYGIVLDETRIKQEAYRVGIARVGEELTEAQHAIAAISVIQNDATAIMGAAARNSDKYAERIKALKSTVNDLEEAFGARMIKALNQAIDKLGGTQKIVDMVSIAFSAIAGVSELFIDKIVRLGQWLIALVEQLGGTDQAIKLVDQSVSALGDTLVAVWQGARITFLGFKAGIDTVVIAIKGIGFLLVNWLNLNASVAGKISTVWRAISEVVLDVFDAIQDGVYAITLPAYEAWATGTKQILDMIGGLASAFGLDFVADQVGRAQSAVDGVLAKFKEMGAAARDLTRPIRDFVADVDDSVQSAQRFASEWARVVGRDLAQDLEAYLQRTGAGADQLADAWRKFTAAGGRAVADTRAVWAQIAAAMREASRRAGEDAGKNAGTSWLVALAATLARGAAEAETARRMREALESAGARAQGAQRPKPYERPQPAQMGVMPGVAGIQAAVQLLDKGRSVLSGFADGWRAMTVGVTAADRAFAAWRIGAEGAQQVYQALTDSVANLFVEMADGGKNLGQVWETLKRQVLLAIGQMIAKMLAMKATQALLGFFGIAPTGGIGGGGGGNTGGLFAMGGIGRAAERAIPVGRAAVGGVTNGPTWMLAGEGRYKREAYVPLPDGRSIPAVISDPGGGAPVINFNVTAMDARSFDDRLIERGELLVELVQRALVSRRGFRMAVRGA